MTENTVFHSLYIGEKINHAMIKSGLPAIPDHVLLCLLAAVTLIVTGFIVRQSISFAPKGIQNIFEALFVYVEKLMIDIIGPEGPRYFSVIATLGLFIFTSNIFGIIPFVTSPTSNLNVTLGCALFVFGYYHYQGVRKHGLRKYLAHFAGPYIFLAPLFFPLEIISHLSRVMSLSIRLFGNIMGEDIILIILFLMSPWFIPIPVPMMLFAIFTSVLQSFIFIMLSMMYIAGAVADETH